MQPIDKIENIHKQYLNHKWTIFYNKVNVEQIKGYDLIIIESEHYSLKEITFLKAHNAIVLGYFSLSELNINHLQFHNQSHLLHEKHKNWDSYYLDITHKKYKDYARKQMTSSLEKGVGGLFFDNIDNTSPWGIFKGQEDLLLSVIQDIKSEYQSIKLLINGGIWMHEKIAALTMGWFLESLFTQYDFAHQETIARDESYFSATLEQLHAISMSYKLPVYLIEYCSPKLLAELNNHLPSHWNLQCLPIHLNYQYASG